jgi:hypothetical protein
LTTPYYNEACGPSLPAVPDARRTLRDDRKPHTAAWEYQVRTSLKKTQQEIDVRNGKADPAQLQINLDAIGN